MPKQKTDDLLALIKSLTRAEKRHFRLFVRRNQASDDILFLKLFDFMDKHKAYDESQILKKIPAIKKRQLSNLKAHLYKQLLVSLRLLNANHNEDIQLREMVDYSRVLYDKGLYRQALDMLTKAKELAYEAKLMTLAMEIVEFEKLIEGQYITRSIEGRAEGLTAEALQLSESLNHTNQFSNLSLQLYGLYLKVGYVRNEKDYFYVREFFQSNLPKADYQALDFFGKLYFCQSHVWFYHMTQEFALCYRYAQKWVDLFGEHASYRETYAPLYLKGLHNLLNSLFNTLQYKRFGEVLLQLHAFKTDYGLSQSKNIEGLYYLYHYIHSIKQHFLTGTFTQGLNLVPDLMKAIEEDRYNWDERREMVFYYRIACLYFGSGDNDKTIDYLNLIINQKNPDYRADIQCFARILNLIAHYELGNAQLVEYQVKSVYRFLSKMEELHAVQKEIFRFIRRVPRIMEEDLKAEFSNLRDRLLKHEADPYERRPFLYLDIISWLEAKVSGRTVESVVQEKAQDRYDVEPEG
ncbi:MAG: hypothetical protein RIC19_11300 [Phaeodactylibacter sp.]|uniref:hypothetical protein n=1 Tax=Phaeodactylibacter sp. TaxID=1940289 RepID=UPI0032EEAAAB